MKKILLKSLCVYALNFSLAVFSQVPVANFGVNPNPACTGSLNSVSLTDNSSNSPTAWSYTVVSALGPGAMTSTLQNPSFVFNMQGTYTISLVATNGSGSSVVFTQTISVRPSPNAQINPQNQTTCPGSNPVTIAVFSGGGPATSLSYSWSNGATTSTIGVSPAVTTTYSCVITSTNGCSTERTATVTIAQATVSIVSNPVSICPGFSSTMTATGTSPGPFTYSWSTGAISRTISANTAGNYSVTVTNSSGCVATQVYSLASSPTLSLTATSNPSILCAGNSATLRATGASSYSWSTGAATQNSSVNPLSTTVYTVSGLSGTCSGVTTITLNVNVTPTITINANSTIVCEGTPVLLNANGATTYTWLPFTVSQSISVTPSVNTTYTVRGNNPGCPSRNASVSIVVNPSPVLSVSSSSNIICAGEVLALVVTGATSYTWNDGSNNSIILVTPTITTTYTVSGANSSNCRSTTSITQNVNTCTGIVPVSQTDQNLELFPNPASGKLSIITSAAMHLKLINMSGAVLKELFLFDAGEHQFDVSELPAGIYFITATGGGGMLHKKLLVAK